MIILSAVAAGIAVPFALDQAGVPALAAYAAGVVAALVVLWVVAALVHVHLNLQGWE